LWSYDARRRKREIEAVKGNLDVENLLEALSTVGCPVEIYWRAREPNITLTRGARDKRRLDLTLDVTAKSAFHVS